MAKLSYKERKKLPTKDFALGKGHYPIENKNHARAALQRASEFASPEEKAEIRSKVHAKYPSMQISKSNRGSHFTQTPGMIPDSRKQHYQTGNVVDHRESMLKDCGAY